MQLLDERDLVEVMFARPIVWDGKCWGVSGERGAASGEWGLVSGEREY